MKKLTLVTLISGALSAGVCAADPAKNKADSTFADIDRDQNGYETAVEAEDVDVFHQFAQIDYNSDNQITREEFQDHAEELRLNLGEDVSNTTEQANVVDANEKEMNRGDTRPVDGDWDTVSDGDHFEREHRKESIARSEFDEIDSHTQEPLFRSEAERQENIYETFKEIDRNNDELITQIEYSRYYEKNSDNYDE